LESKLEPTIVWSSVVCVTRAGRHWPMEMARVTMGRPEQAPEGELM
jgi:hypothetical protein